MPTALPTRRHSTNWINLLHSETSPQGSWIMSLVILLSRTLAAEETGIVILIDVICHELLVCCKLCLRVFKQQIPVSSSHYAGYFFILISCCCCINSTHYGNQPSAEVEIWYLSRKRFRCWSEFFLAIILLLTELRPYSRSGSNAYDFFWYS